MERKTNITIAAHNGNFHADDIFAVAALSLVLEKQSPDASKDIEIEIIRTRDVEKINAADYVVDVGGIYNSEQNRFDHHQSGGAGKRDNGVPYSSIGLVWKKYGKELAGSSEAALDIDQRLVQPIDAGDNGIDLLKDIHSEILPLQLNDVIRVFKLTWKEDQEELLERFLYLVSFAKNVLQREIKFLKDNLEAKSILLDIYNKIPDKRLLILDKYYPFKVSRSSMPDVLLVIYPDMSNKNWCLESLEENEGKFNQKILMPQSWAGKRDDELEKVSGVKGAVFCHNRLFFAVAATKEAAIQLAQMTLNQ